MKDCKFVKYYIMKYQIDKNSNMKFWPFWKLFGLIVKERERQGRLLCRRVVVVRGCRLWHIGEDSFFQMLGDGGIPTSQRTPWLVERVRSPTVVAHIFGEARQRKLVCATAPTALATILSPWSQGESGLRTYTAHHCYYR